MLHLHIPYAKLPASFLQCMSSSSRTKTTGSQCARCTLIIGHTVDPVSSSLDVVVALALMKIFICTHIYRTCRRRSEP